MFFKIDKKTFFRKFMAVLIGDAISAVGLVFFLKPNHMIAGGIEGISVLIEYLTQIPLGLLIVLFNLPILALAIFLLDRDFAFFSVVSIFTMSGYVTLYEYILPNFAITNNIVLACIYGGLFKGIGVGLQFRNGASTGGLDIIAAIMKRYYNISIGNVLLGLNFFIIGFSAFIFNIDKALYTFVALAITYRIIDIVQMGVGKQKQVIIVSKKDNEIAKQIQDITKRGVTYLSGEGAYEHYNFKVMYIVCKPRELVTIKKIALELDPEVFITISDTSEIVGKGFRKIEI